MAKHHRFRVLPVSALVLAVALSACTPAAQPSPTAAPAQTAPTAAPAPAKQAPTTAPAQAAKPAASPAAKAAFDEQAVADFYKGKTVKIIVGFAAGGGFDAYARAISRHLGKHIPGNPSVITENMEGAGSLVAANTVFRAGPKDGTTIVHFHGNQVVQQLLGNTAVQFEASEFNWLGAPVADTSVCAVTKDSGFTSLAEATGSRQLILGGEAPGATTSDIPHILQVALDLNIKVVQGYQGTSKIRLAADQGEVMGGCWGWPSIKSTWADGLEKGDVVIIGQGGKTAHPDLPKVPLMRDMAKTDDARQLIDAGITLPTEIARPFALPPDTPADRVQALRAAFAATLDDKEFQADAEKAKLALGPIPGTELEQNIKELFSLPAEVKAKLKAVMMPG